MPQQPPEQPPEQPPGQPTGQPTDWTASGAGAGPAGADGLPPVRPPLSLAGLKEIVFLLTNLPVDLIGFVYVVVVLSVGMALSFTVVGLPLLAAGLVGSRFLGRLERARARRLLGVRVDEPRSLRRRTFGYLPWLWASVKDPVAWRHSPGGSRSQSPKSGKTRRRRRR